MIGERQEEGSGEGLPGTSKLMVLFYLLGSGYMGSLYCCYFIPYMYFISILLVSTQYFFKNF